MKRTFWVLAAVVLAAFVLGSGTACFAKSMTALDKGHNVGQYTSLALDSSGNPVISYYDATSGDWLMMICPNASCTDVENWQADMGGDVGQYTSVALDSNGYPAFSWYDVTNHDLKVRHCTDTSCDGGTITTPDTGGDVGQYTSLALDSSDHPVVSYYDATNDNLKVLHCNDASCGGGTITTPDTAGDVGQYTSLALNDDMPVVSYYDVTNGNLKVLVCNDPACAPGSDSIKSPDTVNNVGAYTSLALDGTNPVVSYYDVTNGNLKVLHCNDANCDPNVPEGNGAESITSPDTAGAVGAYTSLELDVGESLLDDGNIFPVVSYYDLDNGDLKVMRCNDANCDPDVPEGNGAESITSPDTVGDVGQYTSLALDSSDNPSVSYYDADHGTMKVLDCDDANCAPGGDSITTADPGGYVGLYTSLRLDGSGKPVVSYWDAKSQRLKVLHCDDANCTSGSVTTPDPAWMAGQYTSLALSGGNPVVSYYDVTNGNLKVLHCNDPNCGEEGETIESPDTAGNVGPYTSLALSGGNPVVSYYDVTNGDLKVLHCNDANCVGSNESITSPDTGGLTGDVGQYTSLALDTQGNPVVSYYDATNGDLKVLHCGSIDCTQGQGTPTPPPNSITSPDTGGLTGDVGRYTSLVLDGSGNPVVSYYDVTNGKLKVMHCDDANCAGNNESITSPGTGVDVGQYTSLFLDGSGYPVVSYYDATNGDLKVLHCDDANCAGDEWGNITFPDAAGNVGQHTSLRLDGSGKPVVSYLDYTNGDLKVLVLLCDKMSCATAAYPPAGTDVLPVTLSFEHVYLCAEEGETGCVDGGAATFTGTGIFSRKTPQTIGGYNTIPTEVLSMVLTGEMLDGDHVTIRAGTNWGLPPSTGQIREQTPATFYPADTWFDLFFEVESSDANYDGTQNCDFGGGAQAVRFSGVTMAVPATYVEYQVPSCPAEPPPSSCVVGCAEGGLLAASEMPDASAEQMWRATDGSGDAAILGVGGIAEWPGTAAEPDSSADSPAGSGFNYTALGAALGAAAGALAVGAWFARRRWVW